MKKEKPIPKEDKRKGNSGRKTIFVGDEPAEPFWTSFPKKQYAEIAEKVDEIRDKYLKPEELEKKNKLKTKND